MVPSEPKCLVDYLALLIQRFGRRAGDMKHVNDMGVDNIKEI